MKKSITTYTALIFTASILFGALITNEASAKSAGSIKKQTTCPVMGNAIDKKFYADYKGSRIYFCCKGCIQDFKKNPNKYINKLKKSGVVLEKTPVATTSKAKTKNTRNDDHGGHDGHSH